MTLADIVIKLRCVRCRKGFLEHDADFKCHDGPGYFELSDAMRRTQFLDECAKCNSSDIQLVLYNGGGGEVVCKGCGQIVYGPLLADPGELQHAWQATQDHIRAGKSIVCDVCGQIPDRFPLYLPSTNRMVCGDCYQNHAQAVRELTQAFGKSVKE